ncbi:MAG TPA: MFS transporter, partial [Anaerolineaceae bacterium]|nr:MFS transporter [Anaerolineaceae bacterium]
LLSVGMFTQVIFICASLILAALLLTITLVKEKPLKTTADLPMAGPGWNPFRLDVHHHNRFVWLVVSRFFFLLGTYAVGRFLLLFIAERLNLPPEVAAEQSGLLLAGLAFITFLISPAAGWAADRFGRMPLMLFGAIASGVGVLAYIFVVSFGQLVFFGGLLSLGSATFISANWAMTADVVPRSEAARYFGLANVGTGGAAAAAGLFGLLVDGVNRSIPGAGFTALFLAAAAAFFAASLSLMKLRQTGQPPSE